MNLEEKKAIELSLWDTSGKFQRNSLFLDYSCLESGTVFHSEGNSDDQIGFFNSDVT